MSSFTDPLQIQQVDNDETRWKIIGPFRYWTKGWHIGDENNPEECIVVPVGFVTDFASVPKLFWNILPPTGRYGKAAIVHDFLYFTAIVNKDDADSIFLEAMKVLGVAWATRQAMYYAVHWFGNSAWDGHRKNGHCLANCTNC